MDIDLVNHVKVAFENAENNTSKLSDEILALEGFSGKKTRHFYNNLLSKDNISYLEIGTWKGATVCSAMYNNNATVVCIDNWSELGGPKHDFLVNFDKFKGANNATFIEGDCYTITHNISGVNVYLYDGNHTFESQYNALTKYINSLADTFIFIVDDWNWDFVRESTKKSIVDLNLTVLYDHSIIIPSEPGTHLNSTQDKEGWWNGIYFGVLKKTL
jgi:hypothetical protein